MKSFKTIIFCAAALLAATMISCSKENPMQDNGQDNIPASETISVCVDGLLGEYDQENDTKASLSGAIRVKWAAGDKVYAYDATQCLGELTVSLKNGIDYFAVLSGNSLKTPVDGTTTITLVYSNIFTEAPAIADGKIKIDLSEQTASTKADNMPFVAYSTLDYSVGTTEISNQIADFSFATSLMRLNCTGLEASAAIFGANLVGMGNECLLNVTNDGASVGQGEIGRIYLELSGISASVNGAQTIYASLAKTVTSEKQSLEVFQGTMCEYPFSSKERNEGKLFNAILIQKNAIFNLPGEFTVGEDEDGNPKRVIFSIGNLWASSQYTLHFEDNQWEFNINDTEHISFFTWSSNIKSAISRTPEGDYLFCDEAHHQNDIDGSEDYYYALTTEEWQYLFNDERMKVPGKKSHTCISRDQEFKIESQNVSGIFLYPDNYNGVEIGKEGAPSTWATINSKGSVFLPMTGSSVCYWSSSPNGKTYAYSVFFDKVQGLWFNLFTGRAEDHCLRLVTNVR